MLLVHVQRLTNRLGYTLNVVFQHLLRIPYQITTDTDYFQRHSDAKICYGPSPVGSGIFFRSAPLLFETSITQQEVSHLLLDDTHCLFSVPQPSAMPFDPFAAIFFMLSRYEEYLPHPVDTHGRFPASQSIAFRHGFLQQAVVDRWILMVRDRILSEYPDLNFPSREPDYPFTIDIDAAYCYRHKGMLRTMRGFLLDALVRRDLPALHRRLKVILGKEKDPFDTFDYILSVTRQHPSTKPVFFILLGDYSLYDKPIAYTNRYFRLLIQHLGDSAKMGLHPSYYVAEHPEYIEVEKQRLSGILHRNIVRTRSHFLRLRFPQTYHDLIDAGLTHDYTMGYPDEPGFRCGTGSPYPFFDLSTNQEQPLTIHPFIVMDTTLNTYKHLSPEQAIQVYLSFINETRHTKGTLSTLWHNQNLCETFGWQGWRNVFETVATTAGGNQ